MPYMIRFFYHAITFVFCLLATACVSEILPLESDENEEQFTPLSALDSDTVTSPLARLTNTEFVNSVRSALDLENDSANVEDAIAYMSAESVVSGLASDATAQSFSASTISGYLSISSAAISDFIDNADDIESLRSQMKCDELQVQFGRQNVSDYSSVMCFQDFSRSLFIDIYGSPWTSDSDDFSEFLVDVETYVDDVGADSESLDAMEVRLQAMGAYLFLTPEFLLFLEAEGEGIRELSSIEIGKRLAYFLTGSVPDHELAAAANEGLLTDPAVRLLHANRLLESAQISAQFASFFVGWLGVSASIDQVDDSDVEALTSWLTTWFEQSQPFSMLYSGEVNVLTDDGLETQMELGVLGSKAFVASHTNSPVPAFINRGDFLVSDLLCQELPDDIPSEAFEESSTVSETSAELFHELKTIECATCHHIADNYGGLFQQFDEETSLFTLDSRPYAESFDLAELGDVSGEFSEIEDFAFAVGDSQTAAQCASKLLYRHALRRNIDDSGADDEQLNAMFGDWMNSGDTSIKSLLRTIVVSDHFITFYE